MTDYDIEIKKLVNKGTNDMLKTEIWAILTERKTGKKITQRIWWEDDEGVYHDGVAALPVEIRDSIDNAWLEKSRRW